MLDANAARAYTDFSQFSKMRMDAKEAPKEALQEVARQFESIFLNMMLKSMRDASFGNPLFDSNQSEMYQEMFDKQISLDMTKGDGIGLAKALVQQMQKYLPGNDANNNDAAVKATNHTQADPFVLNRDVTQFESKQQFVDTIKPYAVQAAEQLDVDANVLIAQAALETGWGKSIGKDSHGRLSFNLFNIKATPTYDGPKYIKQTVEVENGIAKTQTATFRAYNSYEESFNDYVNFIKNNPRYQEALTNSQNSNQYIDGIHKAGYATDPQYADKVKRVAESLPDESQLYVEEYS